MGQILYRTLMPLSSLAILMLGSTFFNTYISMNLNQRGVANSGIGAVSAAYGLGFFVGALKNESLIRRVGHIRSFAIFASMVGFLVLLQSQFYSPIFWGLLRFFSGICIAGVYLVVESWLLVLGDHHSRGKALALYMIALYMAQALSQSLVSLVDFRALSPYIWAAALASLSIIPVSLKKVDCPQHETTSLLGLRKLYRISPLGFVACFMSGLAIAPIYGLLPVYAQDIGMDTAQIGQMMMAVMLGALALQWPIGHLSDGNRRSDVFFLVISLTTLLSLAIFFFHDEIFYGIFLALLFLVGGLIFSTYPIAISIACDYLDAKDIVAGTGALILLYSAGATLGPMVTPFFMSTFPGGGFFLYIVFICTLMFAFALFRRFKRQPMEPKEQSEFILVPQTSIHVGELNPHSDG